MFSFLNPLLLLFIICAIFNLYVLKKIIDCKNMDLEISRKLNLTFLISTFLVNTFLFGLSFHTTKDLLMSIITIVIYTIIDISLLKNKS